MIHPFFLPSTPNFLAFFSRCGKEGWAGRFLSEGIQANLTLSPYPLVVVCLDCGGYCGHNCACSPLCSVVCTHFATWIPCTFLTLLYFFLFFFSPVPIIKTEPNDEYDSLGSARVPMHSKPFYSQPRLTPIMPVADHDACLIGGYSPCPPCHVTLPPTPPSSSPTLQDLSPVAYSKCLPNSPNHAAPSGPIMPHIQESPGCPSLAHPSSPDHSSPMGMLHSQGSPNHLNSPGTHGYHAIYANSSPSSSPVSHPSTPGATAESPLLQAYSPTQAQAAASSPSLLHEDASPPPMAITVKQEPQELDQMYLDDGEFSELCDAQIVSNVAFGSH